MTETVLMRFRLEGEVQEVWKPRRPNLCRA